MSHIVTIQSQIKNLEILGRVAKKLGLVLEVGSSTIIDYYGKGFKVDAKLTIKDNEGNDCIGFVKSKGQYEMKGDMYALGNQERQLVNALANNYAVEEVKEKILMSGGVINNIKEVNGEITINVTSN